MTTEERLANTFGLTKKDISYLMKKKLVDQMEDENVLTIKIDEKTYKNALSKYREILDKYYPKPWRVFVTAKMKIPNKLEGILNIFLKNSKKAVQKEMDSFNPSFLLSKDGIFLLVSIQSEKIEISRIEKNSGDKRFNFRGFRYTVANEIKR